MSFDAGTIFARLGLDTDDFDKALGQLGKKATVLGAGIIAAGAGLTAAITLPIVNIGKAALQAGAEAAETENLFNVSFGNMAGAAENWAKRTSDALGLNEFELKKQSGTIFNMVTSMGLARDEAFEMATGMTKLAADMASFRNIPIEEAFAKLRSGITGEAEPLKQLGILVTENFVKQGEFAKSIEATGRSLTEAEKVTARWQAILKQTGNDQGDLARTMDSPINQIRRFRETMAETSAKLGQALLPVLGKFLTLLQPLANAIQKGVDAFAAAPLPIRAVAIGLVGLAAAIGPIIVGIGTLTLGFGALSVSVGAMGFASVTAGLVALKGVVLAAGSAILGVLLPAAVALGVAIAAFKIGKWADDFFGFSTVIGDTITNLLNLRAAATEVNRIQFTAMQKASEGMGRQVLDWAEATKINAERIKGLQAESLRAAGATETHSKSIQEQVRELLAAKESTDLLGKASSLAGVEITDMAMAQEVLRQTTKATKTELDHLVESFEARTFEGIAKEAAQVNTALARMKGTLPIEEARRLRDEWEPWVNELKLTAPALQAVIERANAMRDAGKRLLDAWIGPTTMALPDLTNELKTFGDISSELPRDLLSLGDGLSNAERKALGFPPILETMSQKTESFGGALQQTSILLATFHKGLGSIFGAGASFAQGFSSLFGKGLEGFKTSFKDLSKGGAVTFGSFFSGLANALPAIGALVGPVFSLLSQLFKPKWKKLAEEGATLFGKEFSESLAKQLEKDLKSVGSLQNAISKNIGDVAADVGVNASNIQEMVKQFGFALGTIENGTFDLTQQSEQLEKAFGLIAAQLDKMGIAGAVELGGLVSRMRELGAVTGEVQSFIQEKARSAVENLSGFFEFLIKKEQLTGSEAEHALTQVAGAFAAAIQAGGGLIGAFELLGPGFGDVVGKLREVLGSENAVLNEIASFYNFVADNNEQLQALQSLSAGFEDLVSIGIVNKMNITDFSASFIDQFNDILSSTNNQTAALAAMGPQIGMLLQAFSAMGVEVPPALAEIAAQAEAAGASLVPPEDAVDILSQIRDLLKDLVSGLVAVGDEARRTGSALSGMPRGGGRLGDGFEGPEFGQHGFRGLVGGPVGPVGFVAGEGGLERVTIEPLGGRSQGGGGAHGSDVAMTLNLSIDARGALTDANELARHIVPAVEVVFRDNLRSIKQRFLE